MPGRSRRQKIPPGGQGRVGSRGSLGEESPEDSSPPSSLSSSYGSTGGDLAEMREMRSQFNNQEQLLGQLRDALQSNNQRLQSKDKEDYASRLAQMRSSRKGTTGPPRLVSPTPEEMGEEDEGAVGGGSPGGSGGKKTRGARMQMLRKQLDESKARQERELSSRQDLETIVAGLQRELAERDVMIANMSVGGSLTSSIIGSPFVMSPEMGSSPTGSPGHMSPPHRGFGEGYSSSYYDLKEQVSAKENKVLELNEEVANLNRKVFDLEENLKEKDEVISARTAAVGLASASLAAKGKDTLDQLEDTRGELAIVQERWAKEQAEWRRVREEARIQLDSASARVVSLQEANRRLERSKDEVTSKNQELRDQVDRLEMDLARASSKAREDKILLEARLEEIEEEKLAVVDRSKLKGEILEERIRNLEERRNMGGLEEEERISVLENSLAEAEEEKGALQLRLVDMEEVSVADQKLKTRLKEAEEGNRRLADELDCQTRSSRMIEGEKIDLMEAIATRDTELFDLQEEVDKLVGGREELSRAKLELEMRCVELEEQRDQWEGERLELVQEIEHHRTQSKADMIPMKDLQETHAALVDKYERFSLEHNAAMERSKLYDRDMLDKARKIKEQQIDLKTLENLLHEKTKDIANLLADVDRKETELLKSKESMNNFEDIIGEKEAKLSELEDILAESEEHQNIVEINSKMQTLQLEMKALVEENRLLTDEVDNRNAFIEKDRSDFIKEKEELNLLLEKGLQEKYEFAENNSTLVRELEETLESKSIELTEKSKTFDELCQSNLSIQNELEEAKKGLEAGRVMIEDLKHSFESKDATLDKILQESEELHLKLSEKANEIESLKSNYEEKIIVAKENNKTMSEKLEERNTDIDVLQSQINMKSEEIVSLNEEVTEKYKIIEGLQTEIQSLVDVNSTLSAETEKNRLSVEELKLNEIKLQEKNTELTEDLHVKITSMERLQTVIDVFEEQNKETQTHSGNLKETILENNTEIMIKETKISELLIQVENLSSENLILQNNNIKNETIGDQIDEMSIHLTTLQNMRENYEEKIKTLENENEALEELPSEIADFRQKLMRKEEENVALSEKLAEKSEQLLLKDKNLCDSLHDGTSIDNQYLEQIEMLRIQLREKSELLLASESDSKLQMKLSDSVEDLEIKSQEIENLRTIIRHLEVDKVKLEAQMSEIEQFRQEVSKEANQHMEETGEKIRELKIQFDDKQEEVNQLTQEKCDLQSKLEHEEELSKSYQTKYDDFASNSSNPEIVKERDNLKAKNEKLTNMCKKYLAKLKQQEVIINKKMKGGVDNSEFEDLNKKILELEVTVSDAKSENCILLDEMTSKYQIIEGLQNQLHQKDEEMSVLLLAAGDIERTLVAKDEVIRDLKQKLEEAPEADLVPISVPVNIAEATIAHEKTKTELVNLKEKCKKLIVKLKQQDAQLKKKAKDSKVTAHTDDHSALESELPNLKAENNELKKELDAFTASAKDLSQLEISLTKSEETNDNLKKERTKLYEEQVLLKDQVRELKVLNQNLHQNIEQTTAELKMVRETNITNQMKTSSMLGGNAEFSGFEDGDDGWGSPDLEKKPFEPECSSLKGEVVLGNSEVHPKAAEINEKISDNDKAKIGLHSNPAIIPSAEDTGEGWGTWEENIEIPTQPIDSAAPMAFPAGPMNLSTLQDVEPQTSEREADIEDGWGDDSWGGFGDKETSDALSANLRLGSTSPNQDDDGLPLDHSRNISRTDRRSCEREDSVQQSHGEDSQNLALKLQGKLAEKDSVIESIENDLTNAKKRCVALENELRFKEDNRNQLDRIVNEKNELLQKVESDSRSMKQKLSESIEKNQSIMPLENEVTELKEEKLDLENKLSSLSLAKEDVVNNLTEAEGKLRKLEGLQDLEIKYQNCLELIENMEENLEKFKIDAEANKQRNKSINDDKMENINLLESELNSLTGQLEEKGNQLSDLQENLSHFAEQRKSMDITIADLQASLTNKQEEIDTMTVKLSNEDSIVGLTSKIEILHVKIEDMTREETMKADDIQQLNMLRDNLFTENDSLQGQVKLQQNQIQQLQTEINTSSNREETNAQQIMTHKHELDSLHSMVTDLTTENEFLQAEVRAAREQVTEELARASQLQDQLYTVEGALNNQQHLAPPDITNNNGAQGGQPDIAQAGRQQVNPDIMSGALQMNPPDIMGGQQPLDLVQPQAGGWEWGNNPVDVGADNWFDNFEHEPPALANQIPDVEQVHQQIQQAEINSIEVELQQSIQELQAREELLNQNIQQLHVKEEHLTKTVEELQESIETYVVTTQGHEAIIQQHSATIQQQNDIILSREVEYQKNVQQLQTCIDQSSTREGEVQQRFNEILTKEKELQERVDSLHGTIAQHMSTIESLQANIGQNIVEGQKNQKDDQEITENNQSLGVQNPNLCEEVAGLRTRLHNSETGFSEKTAESDLLRQQLTTVQIQLQHANETQVEQLQRLKQFESEYERVKGELETANKGTEVNMREEIIQTIGENQPNLEQDNQPSPLATVFNLGASTNTVKDDNSASSYFDSFTNHDASFSGVGSVGDVLEKISPETSKEEIITTDQTSDHTNSFCHHELDSVEGREVNEQIEIKEVSLNQLTANLTDLKKELEGKENEIFQMKLNSDLIQADRDQQCLQLRKQEAALNELNEKNQSLKQELVSLNNSMELSHKTITDMQHTLTCQEAQSTTDKDDGHQLQTHQDSVSSNVSQNDDDPSTGAILQEEKSLAASYFGSDNIKSTGSLFGELEATPADFLNPRTVEIMGANSSQLMSTTPETSLCGQESEHSSSSLFPRAEQNESKFEEAPVHSSEQDYLVWYQQELAQYQQACQDWQIWGDQKTQEIQDLTTNSSLQADTLTLREKENDVLLLQLKEQDQLIDGKEVQNKEWQLWADKKNIEVHELLSHAQVQTETLNSQKTENEELQKVLNEKDEFINKNDIQNQLKVKELEIVDLRETIDRIDSEKEELNEEILELRKKVDESQSISENDSSYDENLLTQLDDLKSNLEYVEMEKNKLSSELIDMTNTLAILKSSNEDIVNGLQSINETKSLEVENLLKEIGDSKTEISDLEGLLEEEKKVQEEVGDEFEAMQLQVQESSSRINELLSEAEEMRTKIEGFSNYEEVVNNYESSSKRVSELEHELEDLKEKLSQMNISKEAVEEAQISEGMEDPTKKLEAATLELEQHKQVLAEWATWAETKNTEYNALLEAYNQYVEAYNNLQANASETTPVVLEGDNTSDESTTSLKELENELVEKNKMIEKVNEEKGRTATELLEVEERYKESILAFNNMEESKIQLEMNAETKEKELQTELIDGKHEITELEAEVMSLKQTLGELVEMEGRYKESLLELNNLEESKIQLEMNAEAKETELQSELSQSRLKIEELQTELEKIRTLKEDEDVIVRDGGNFSNTEELIGQLERVNTEMDQYKQSITEWSSWAESKTTENSVILEEKDQEIARLKDELQGKEKELTEKTGIIAKMNIKSALSLKLLESQTKEVTTHLQSSNDNVSRDREAPEEVSVSKTAEQNWEEEEGWAVEDAEEVIPTAANVLELEKEISKLKQKVISLQNEKDKAVADVNTAKLKNGKMLLKIKTLTKEIENVKKNSKNVSDFDDLDKAMEEEMKRQLDKCQNELRESKKELDTMKLEKENISRKLDTLESANGRLIEMKERQDNEVEFLSHKNTELSNQIEGLNWNFSELEDRRVTEVSELTNQIAVFTSQDSMEGGVDNTQLKLEVAEWKTRLAEATQESDRLRSDLAAINKAQALALNETAVVKSQIIDLQDTIDHMSCENEKLKMENESLQEVSEGEGFNEIRQLNDTLNNEITSLKKYIEAQSQGIQPSAYNSQNLGGSEVERLRDQLAKEQQLVLQLEQDLQSKESQLNLLENELLSVTEQKASQEVDLRAKIETRDRSESVDREIMSAFSDTDMVEENLKLKADLDSSMRERRQLAARIKAWQTELGRETFLDDEGLRGELRQAIKTLQIREHKCEELTNENLHLLEERDALMLKLSAVMRQLEGSRAPSAMSSMAGSRTTTPVPPGAGGGHFPNMQPVHHFNPHAEIRELHSKLEELRRLNYSLDVELQRERGERVVMGDRVMAPRSREASQMLKDSSPEKVQHI